MFKKIDTLFNKMNLRILRFLSENPMDSYYERELAGKSGVSPATASNCLKTLTSLGVVSLEKKAKLHFYRLNADNPLARQFKVLFTIEVMCPLLERLREHSKRIVLFGSASQGTDTSSSDIDLLIVSEREKKILPIISEFSDKARRHISPIILPMDRYMRLKRDNAPLYDNITRGITLWDANGL